MSDSDDTDILLLIPPDFYVIQTPLCPSPVNCIKSSTNCVESFGDVLINRLLAFNDVSPPIMESKIVNSTPLPNRPHLTILAGNQNNKFSPIPSLDLSSGKTHNKASSSAAMWPPKGENIFRNTLIDRFIGTNVKSVIPEHFENVTFKFEKYTNKISGQSTINPAENSKLDQLPKFSLRQVDRLLNEMEKTREEIKSKLQSNKNKIYEMRRQYSSSTFNADGNMKQSKGRHFEVSNSFNNTGNLKNDSKKLLNTDVNLVLTKKPENMLHLSRIMSKDNDHETLHQKLETEILKRKHCEEVVQQLQSNILEQQENLNVALKVDIQKNEFIERLRQSSNELVGHWKELEHQRQELALMLEQERVDATNNKTNFTENLELLENRLHGAVSLTNNYRDKYEKLEKSLNESNNEKHSLHKNLNKTKQYVTLLEMEKREMLQQMELLTNHLADEKDKRLTYESESSNYQTKFSSLTCERNELAEKYEEEVDTVNRLKADLVTMELHCTRAITAEAKAVKDLSTIKLEASKLKNSIKEFYQKQLDVALKEKIDQFQKDIDKMQALMYVKLDEQNKLADKKLSSELNRLRRSHEIELSEDHRMYEKQISVFKNELKENRRKLFEVDSIVKSKLFQTVFGSPQYENSLLNAYETNSDDDNRLKGDEEENNCNLGFSREVALDRDLGRYIEMLLELEPNNPANKIDYQLLFDNQHDDLDCKHINCRRQTDIAKRKPPWK